MGPANWAYYNPNESKREPRSRSDLVLTKENPDVLPINQDRPYTSTSRDARERLVAHVRCSSELLAAAREGETLELLEQSPGPVFGSCIECAGTLGYLIGFRIYALGFKKCI